MSPKTTLIAAVILAALSAYIYFYEREPVEDADSDREAIFELEAEQIREIEIVRPGDGENVRLKRSGEEDWEITAPIQAPADSTSASSLADDLASLERERIIAEGEAVTLSDFGLDAPELAVRFKVEDLEEERAVLFGNETPTGMNLYAKLEDQEAVFVLSSGSKYSFDKKAWDLRDKTVLDFERDDVEQVVLKQPDAKLVLAKASEDQWNLTEPTFARADRYKAGGLVSTLETSKMEEIVSESPEGADGYGLTAPDYEVTVDLKGGRSVSLLVGDEKDSRYYARNPDRPLVFLIGSSVVDDIKKEPAEFFSKKLFDYATYQVDKLEIAFSDGTTDVFEKSEQDEETIWKRTAPETESVDKSKVEDLLYKLNGTEAEELITEGVGDLARFGLESPAFEVTVWSKDEQNVEKLSVGRPEEDTVYARREGDQLILKLTASSWEDIEALMRFEEAEEEGEETDEGS